MAEPVFLGLQIGVVATGRRGGEGDSRGDVNACTAKTGDLARVVRQKPYGVDAEAVEDSGRWAVVAGVDGQSQLQVGVDGVGPVVLFDVREQLVDESDAATFVAGDVDEHSTSFCGDRPQRL